MNQGEIDGNTHLSFTATRKGTRDIRKGKLMRATSAALVFAASLSLPCWQSASALPADGAVVQEAAKANSQVEDVQFYERTTRHYIIKCYREFVIGPYRCHRFRRWF